MNVRNRTSLIATTVALSAAFALPAMAQTAQQNSTAAQQSGASGGGQTWASVDTDSSGAISKQEAQVNAGLAQIFDQADADGNGQLTPDEYKGFVAKQQAGASSATQDQQQ